MWRVNFQGTELARLTSALFSQLDGWALKPVDVTRLRVLMTGAIDPKQRKADVHECVSLLRYATAQIFR